jgi:RNA polymerase sigma-70 factor, ECF subfamily
VFGLDFAEVSRTLGRSEVACRQLAARAREHIAAGRPRFPASSEDGHRLAAAFHQAARSGDVQALVQMLAHDVVLYSDGGGKRFAALNPIHGRKKVLRLLEGARKKGHLANRQVRDATINGLPGFVVRCEDGSIDTVAFECHDGRITTIYIMRNPDKLRHVRFWISSRH